MMLIRSVVEAGEPFFGSRVVEPMPLIRTHLANHIRASSREEWLHLQARHMTAPDRNRHHANSALDAGAPSTHDPQRPSRSKCFCGAACPRVPSGPFVPSSRTINRLLNSHAHPLRHLPQTSRGFHRFRKPPTNRHAGAQQMGTIRSLKKSHVREEFRWSSATTLQLRLTDTTRK
jgi:hypothetical protein